MSLPLRSDTLPVIKAANSDLAVPAYDLAAVKIGIVHFGPGNFHLAHLAMITHRLMQSGAREALQWGICGVSLQSPDRRDTLRKQDYLYTVVEQSSAQSDGYEICGAVREILFAPEDPAAVIGRIAASDTKIVSMAMTGNGYYLDSTGKLMLGHADLASDLATLREGRDAQPLKTAWGYMAAGLKRRMDQRLDGFTVLSCDNIQHNGDYTKGAFLAFLTALGDVKLLAYAQENLSFPNSMVDRIVPKSSAELSTSVEKTVGYQDLMAVPAEPMPQIPWVIEDKFVGGRPEWEEAGAMFVPDVAPFEKMKLRLLNASHSVIACLGDLLGLKFIYETMEDGQIRKVMENLMAQETVKTLDPVAGVDLAAYQQELITRFSNPAVKDTVERVATDAPLQTVLDSLQDRLAANASIDLLALGLTAWLLRAKGGVNEAGRVINVRHPDRDLLAAKAQEGCKDGQLIDPRPMLGISHLFGAVGQNPRVVEAVTSYLETAATVGLRHTIATALRNCGARMVPAAMPEGQKPRL